MPPRAAPMTPQERHDQLVDVTLRLLREHGRAVTTKQIAEAAGIAEGTIFRVVTSKDELVDAALARAFDHGAIFDRIAEIDPALDLRDRMVRLVSILQQRFRATFGLIRKVGMLGPPAHLHDSAEADAVRARLERACVELVGADAEHLSVEPGEMVHRLRLLTFAGSHEQVADGRLLSPEEIVDTVLTGLLAPAARPTCADPVDPATTPARPARPVREEASC